MLKGRSAMMSGTREIDFGMPFVRGSALALFSALASYVRTAFAQHSIAHRYARLVVGLSVCFWLVFGLDARAELHLPVPTQAAKLIAAARAQVGVTVRYDPAYTVLVFPGGDVPEDRGVCTDVIVRAYRKAFAFDLQKAVHDDMGKAFASYPKKWGLKSTDRNIDHRRVPNLQTFFTRRNVSLPVMQDASVYRPGDLVTQMLPGNLPHIAIVSDRKNRDGTRPLVIHNIGSGAREEDTLFAFPITGHYRFLVH